MYMLPVLRMLDQNIQQDPDRGEGANHAIVNELEFVERVLPDLNAIKEETSVLLRAALDGYEATIIEKTRRQSWLRGKPTLMLTFGHALVCRAPCLAEGQ